MHFCPLGLPDNFYCCDIAVILSESIALDVPLHFSATFSGFFLVYAKVYVSPVTFYTFTLMITHILQAQQIITTTHSLKQT